MEEDVEKAIDIEEEYDYKDDVTKPLKLEKEPEKISAHDEIKANDYSNHDNVTSETIPLTDSNNFQNPIIEENGRDIKLEKKKKKKKALTKEVPVQLNSLVYLNCSCLEFWYLGEH